MKIEILDKAIKDLKKIDKVQAKKILNSISELVKYPNIANVKRLTNHNPTHRLRIGSYRVLFNIENDVIVVSRIKHRKDVYWCSKTKEANNQAINNTIAGIAQRFGLSSEAVMIGVGGITTVAFAYKHGKPVGKALRLRRSKESVVNNGNNKHNQTNSDNFNQHHGNTPFNELYNYTTDYGTKLIILQASNHYFLQSLAFLHLLHKL